MIDSRHRRRDCVTYFLFARVLAEVLCKDAAARRRDLQDFSASPEEEVDNVCLHLSYTHVHFLSCTETLQPP